jgi:hypothetical protein
MGLKICKISIISVILIYSELDGLKKSINWYTQKAYLKIRKSIKYFSLANFCSHYGILFIFNFSYCFKSKISGMDFIDIDSCAIFCSIPRYGPFHIFQKHLAKQTFWYDFGNLFANSFRSLEGKAQQPS